MYILIEKQLFILEDTAILVCEERKEKLKSYKERN